MVRQSRYFLICVVCVAAQVHAQDRSSPGWVAQVEIDAAQTTSNTLQRFNNSTTTRFDVVDYTGQGSTLGRLTLADTVNWWRRGAELRLDIVPFAQTGIRPAGMDIRYAGATFREGLPLSVRYQFNTYRLTFDVPLFATDDPGKWELRIGGTLAIRDAQTRLANRDARVNYVNYGPVPLLYVFSAWRLSPSWRLETDLDGFPAPGGGGLLDTSARLAWSVTSHASVFAGIRYQAGGATSDTFFNFFHQRSAIAGVRLQF